MLRLRSSATYKDNAVGSTSSRSFARHIEDPFFDSSLPNDFWQVDETAIMNPSEGGIYEITLDIFFNAQHHVTIEGKQGPDHSHSYRLRVRCRSRSLTEENHIIIGYQILRERIRQVATAYNNQFLNALPPFQSIQPTTEILTAVIYQQLARILADLPVELVSVTIWDSPTEAITFTATERQP